MYTRNNCNNLALSTGGERTRHEGNGVSPPESSAVLVRCKMNVLCIRRISFVVIFCLAARAPANTLTGGNARNITESRMQKVSDAIQLANDTTVPSSVRVASLVALMRDELEDPTPQQNRWHGIRPMSEIHQTQLIRALASVRDIGCIKEVLDRTTDQAMRERLLVAIAFTEVEQRSTEKAPFIPSLVSMLATSESALIRHQIALALGEIASSDPGYRRTIVPALAQALNDPAEEFISSLKSFPVRQAAVFSLLRLGIPVVRTSFSTWELADPEAASGDVVWVIAREVLTESGFSVAWLQDDKQLLAEKEGRTIRIQAGSKTVEVDGHPAEFPVAPHVVADRLYVSDDLLRFIRRDMEGTSLH